MRPEAGGGHPIYVKRVRLPALDHGSMVPVPVLYAIWIFGHLGALVLSAFVARFRSGTAPTPYSQIT